MKDEIESPSSAKLKVTTTEHPPKERKKTAKEPRNIAIHEKLIEDKSLSGKNIFQ